MTQDEIIEMAREAGLYQDINVSFHQALKNFYDLVAAKEREACAKVAEDGLIGHTIAKAIRARGEA
jgi:hypothetical protein